VDIYKKSGRDISRLSIMANVHDVGDTSSCDTHFDVSQLTFIWTIHNFSFVRGEVGKAIRSAAFSSGPTDKLKWALRINPSGLNKANKEYLSLFLVLVASNKPEVRAKFRFSILNDANLQAKDMSSNRPYRFAPGKDWGFAKFVKKEYLHDPVNKLINDDTINFFCELHVVGEPKHVMHPSADGIPHPVSLFQDHMGSLLRDGKYADCSIKCEGRQFNVHSFIMAARSPHFARFLEHDTAVQGNKTMLVEDISAEVMEELLVYVYTDKAPHLDVMATDLLKAADMYELEHLKVMCEVSMRQTLDSDTAAELYALSDMYHAKQLRIAAVDHVINHTTEVLDTEGWALLCRSRPALIFEAYHLVAARNCVPAIKGKKRKKNK